MSESDRGNPIQAAVVVLLLVGGGWYFLRHYKIDGLDEVSISAKASSEDESTFISYQGDQSVLGTFPNGLETPGAGDLENPFSANRGAPVEDFPAKTPSVPSVTNVRIASWALDGFGPTKLANPTARQHLSRVVRNFDIVALQQIASIERDLVSRLVDVINQGEARYDYVLGKSTGPEDRPEQLAFIFDTKRVRVDRQQTYTIHDPHNHLTFDPLVAWFRTAEPASSKAWTFSLVNIRIDLAQAPSEVALLAEMMESIRNDGRGEDDVIFAGLFQADDAYLIPTLGNKRIRVAVSSRPTDIFGKYQTSNILMDAKTSSEYTGRGGVMDYLRSFNLNTAQAESVSSQLPVYAEFSAMETIPIER